ncbi:MAG: Aspartate aminotransferase [Chlamydiales bacterium]|nr:Aspartate aminotransferase [Chlamydiales bacterium]MCH9619524.1 Aspartate aminotransferase [Chlamydiales bacterium]MCH9623130.1 Aspartate aminotransferase [Chlamydiales bacterium]
MKNYFKNLEMLPSDPIFGVVKSFIEDPRENKIDAIAGTYRGEDLKPVIFPTVKEAERFLIETECSKEYLPIDGDVEYLSLTKKLIFGEGGHLYGAQTIGGTGALRICANFLVQNGFSKIYISNPTWANHQKIFSHAGLKISSFPYYNKGKRGVDFEDLTVQFEQMENGSVVLMQACCHNPSGCDLSLDQWKVLFQLIKKRSLFLMFDLAYQGFGRGIEEDVEAVRYFLQEGVEFAVCASHSKNFGLYAERTGALFISCLTEDESEIVGSHIRPIIRGLYSNPPCHGARIVTHILKNPPLRCLWEKELEAVRQRISEMRILLSSKLSLDFLQKQLGMFAYAGFEKGVVQKLRDDYGVYLPGDGRINVAGLNPKTIESITSAINEAKEL